MQVDENNSQTDDYCPADNEASESESEALKIEDMPQMEDIPLQSLRWLLQNLLSEWQDRLKTIKFISIN